MHREAWLRTAQLCSCAGRTFERLSVRPVTPELHAQIRASRIPIADHPIEMLPEVGETLQYLCSRHHMILVTKGAVGEQTGKIERSGLKDYFAATEILAEKDAAAYHRITRKIPACIRLNLDGRQQP